MVAEQIINNVELCSVWSKAPTRPATMLQRGEDEFVTGNCEKIYEKFQNLNSCSFPIT